MEKPLLFVVSQETVLSILQYMKGLIATVIAIRRADGKYLLIFADYPPLDAVIGAEVGEETLKEIEKMGIPVMVVNEVREIDWP